MNKCIIVYDYILVTRWIKCRIYTEIFSVDFRKRDEMDFSEVLEKSGIMLGKKSISYYSRYSSFLCPGN